MKAKQPDIPIADALRLLREGEKLTQTEVAKRGGPDFRTISHWETGRKMPSLTLLLRFLDALELDLHDLQAAFNQLANRPDKLTSRFTTIERRLNALERWRFEETVTRVDSEMKGEPCERSIEPRPSLKPATQSHP